MKVVNNLIFTKTFKVLLSSIYRLAYLLLVLPVLVILLTRCNKDDVDSEQRRKDSAIRSLLSEVNIDSLQSYVGWLEGMGTRFALADNHRRVAVRIKEKFIGAGYPEARLDSFFITRTFRNITYSQWQYNVIALITGTVNPDSVCILGSHYDDIVGSSGDPFVDSPGAHDNATGTAATLEIARVFKKMNFEPDKSIMFIAFGAEELGLYGSHDFAADPGEFTGKISFMLNNDMIGYEPGTDAEWQVNILDYANSQGLRAEAESLIQKYTGLGYINNNQYNRQSDSYPFYLRGYRALFFSSVKTDPYYHTINDRSSNLNFRYLREITKVSCAILAEKNF